VEGITDLPSLRELRLEYQKLPTGEKLVFDPRSLLAVAVGLCAHILLPPPFIWACGMHRFDYGHNSPLMLLSLLLLIRSDLRVQGSLRVLDVSGNSLDDLADLAPLQALSQLYLADNDLIALSVRSTVSALWGR